MIHGSIEIPSGWRERRNHRRQQRLTESFRATSERLGEQNLQDIFNAFRFATDPDHPEAVDIATGIAEEFNADELASFYRLLRCGRRFGRDAVLMAFSQHKATSQFNERASTPEQSEV